LSLLDGNGVLGTIRLGQTREVEVLVAQDAVTNYGPVSQIIEVEESRSERKATPVSLTALSVN
jgi:hypothetical protein